MTTTPQRTEGWDSKVIEAGVDFLVDWESRIIDATTSITDLVAFHQALRALEAAPLGMLYPVIHNFRALDVGGGGFFYAVEFVNGWQLRFPNPGSYTINGNLNAPIIGAPGVFVMQTKALAFATTSSVGGESAGATPEQVASAVWNHPWALTVAKFIGLK